MRSFRAWGGGVSAVAVLRLVMIPKVCRSFRGIPSERIGLGGLQGSEGMWILL